MFFGESKNKIFQIQSKQYYINVKRDSSINLIINIIEAFGGIVGIIDYTVKVQY